MLLFFNGVSEIGRTGDRGMIVASDPFEKVSLAILEYFILSTFFFFFNISSSVPEVLRLCMKMHHYV